MNAQGTLITVTDCFNHHSQAKRGKKTGKHCRFDLSLCYEFHKVDIGDLLCIVPKMMMESATARHIFPSASCWKIKQWYLPQIWRRLHDLWF